MNEQPNLLDPKTILELALSVTGNNPRIPLPNCASLKVFWRRVQNINQKEVCAYLTFGSETLKNSYQGKSYPFKISLRSAKLRLITIEGGRVRASTVLGTGGHEELVKAKSEILKSKEFSKASQAKLTAALSGVTSISEMISALLNLNLIKKDSQILTQSINKLHNGEMFETAFDVKGPYWNIRPSYDPSVNPRSGNIERMDHIEGVAINFDQPLFRYVEDDAYRFREDDVCFLFGVSAKERDIDIEILEDEDAAWWDGIILPRLNYKNRLEAARISLRRLLAMHIGSESPGRYDSELLFVVAAAEPEVEEW